MELYKDTSTVVIRSQEDLDKHLEKYKCKTFDELSEVLWYAYGIDARLDIKSKKRL